MPGVIEKLQAASKPGVIARLQAASDPTAGQMLQQAGSSFVGGLYDTLNTAKNAAGRVYDVVSDPLGMLGDTPPSVTQDTQAAVRGAVVPEGIPGQSDKFYSRLAGVAGQTVALAPAAAAGLPGVALAGAAIGGEQGLQEAQAAGADVPETVLGALGQAFIGAASAYGPAGAVAKFGIPEASRGLLLEALQGAAVGAGQSLGSDVVAKATYDPERAVDVGRAVNAALEMGIVSGGTHGTLKMLEAAARLRAPKAEEPASKAVESAMAAPKAEESAPVQDFTGSQPRPEEPVLEKAPVAPQTEPVLTRDSAPPPAPPATATPEAGAGGVSVAEETPPLAPAREQAPARRYQYAPQYRPPGFETLPPGWKIDAPPSKEHPFGVVSYDKPIKFKDEEIFQLTPLDPGHPKNIKKTIEGRRAKLAESLGDNDTFKAKWNGRDAFFGPDLNRPDKFRLTTFTEDGQIGRAHV